MKILIAEDESTSRLLLQTHLKKWGHEVVVTEDGIQALRYVESRADVAFSHSICPDCYETRVKPELEAFQAEMEASKKHGDHGNHEDSH